MQIMNELSKSTRGVVDERGLDTKEQGKKELLQYRIFDNDSDGDVIEGLGNTTIDARGIIADQMSSDEDESKGGENRQS